MSHIDKTRERFRRGMIDHPGSQPRSQQCICLLRVDLRKRDAELLMRLGVQSVEARSVASFCRSTGDTLIRKSMNSGADACVDPG